MTATAAVALAASITAAVVLVWAVHVRMAAAAAGLRRRYTPTQPTAPWRPIPDGARWLPCHNLTCAHLTTIHTPQPGGYTCADCRHVNGGHQ